MKIVKPDPTKFVLPEGTREVNMAEHQAHLGYLPLPTLVTPTGEVASQWLPSPSELALLNKGVPVTIVVWTFGKPLQPQSVMVGGADLRP